MTYQSIRIFAPIIIGVTILFTLFGLKPIYTTYMDSAIQLDSVTSTKATKQKELDDLIRMKQSFETASGSTELSEKVKKLSNTWNEADILSSIMLNDYTRGTNFVPAPITIMSISLDAGKKLPNGLSFGTVQFTVSGKSIDDIVGFLTYLTMSAPYVYTLDAISLPITAPIQKNLGEVSLPITLGIYYYK